MNANRSNNPNNWNIKISKNKKPTYYDDSVECEKDPDIEELLNSAVFNKDVIRKILLKI